MDVDSPQEPSSPQQDPSTPATNAPGAYPDTNGTNGATEEKSPTPPPHKAQPPPKPAVDAEACKATGNKFFKAKDFDRAIKEYTKGMAATPDLALGSEILIAFD